MEELTEAARAARNEYARKYRAEHKEQMKQAKIRYWNRKAQQQTQPGTGTAENRHNGE